MKKLSRMFLYVIFGERVMFIDISENLKQLSNYFPENLYVVGGYVRNKLLCLPTQDIDVASSVGIEEVVERLKGSGFNVKIKNAKLGALLITKGNEKFEYTVFRKETYKDDGAHCPCEIELTSKIEEDAIRRDFSVNSIYFNVNKDEIVDYYHGIIDLKQKTIRCSINPYEILKNDGERILRMIRFAGELDFRIDKETLKAAKKYVANIKDIAGSRKYAEMLKILYCDRRYNNQNGLKGALQLFNVLNVWKNLGLKHRCIKYKMIFKTNDRFLGMLIDIIDVEKPECLEAFVEELLIREFGFSILEAKQIFRYLAGYYDALEGMSNKQYFFKYYQDWQNIYPLLGAKSKRIQNKYHFFYQYIIEHGLVIRFADLKISANDIKNNFKKIDKRNYDKILSNLLSKVFDGKLSNEKEELIKEIEENLQNY